MEGATMHDASPTSTEVTAEPAPEGGQAMVELALVLPVLCLILFAALEFGTAFWHYQQVSAAASEGARRAAVSRTASDRDSAIRTAVETASPSLDENAIGVAVSSTWRSGDPVTVTVSYPEQIRVMGITFFDTNLVSRRTARVET